VVRLRPVRSFVLCPYFFAPLCMVLARRWRKVLDPDHLAVIGVPDFLLTPFFFSDTWVLPPFTRRINCGIMKENVVSCPSHRSFPPLYKLLFSAAPHFGCFPVLPPTVKRLRFFRSFGSGFEFPLMAFSRLPFPFPFGCREPFL